MVDNNHYFNYRRLGDFFGDKSFFQNKNNCPLVGLFAVFEVDFDFFLLRSFKRYLFRSKNLIFLGHVKC